uniref:Protein kinase and PP2C-like domain-containing protein n=1 Tax=Rhizophora mucronata TaxID=61149 RepID=A0A2P2JVV6_RHIMU
MLVILGYILHLGNLQTTFSLLKGILETTIHFKGRTPLLQLNKRSLLTIITHFLLKTVLWNN